MNTLWPISSRDRAALSGHGRLLFSNKLECSVSVAATGDAALDSRETVSPGLQFHRCIFFMWSLCCLVITVEARNTRGTPYVNRVVPTTYICCHLRMPSYWMTYTPATTNNTKPVQSVSMGTALCSLFGILGILTFWSFGNLFSTSAKVSSRKQELGDGPTESLKFFKRSKRRPQRQDCSEKRQKCHEEITSQSEWRLLRLWGAKANWPIKSYFRREGIVLITRCNKLDVWFDIVILIKRFYCVP